MRWILGIIFSVLLLLWAFHGIDLTPLLHSFAAMPLWPVLMMILCIILFFAIKAWRWRLLLSPISDFSTSSLMPSMFIGTAVNYVFFGYIGELVRTLILSKKHSSKYGPILMSIVMERIFDFWTLLLLFWMATLFSPTLSPTIVTAGTIAVGLGFIVTLFAMMLVFWPKQILIFISWCCQLFPKSWQHYILEEAQLAIKGLRSIAHPKLLFGIILASIIQWIIMCLCNWFGAYAMGISVPPWALLGPMGLMIIGMAIPSSPGQFGVIEVSYILGLSFWGVPKEQALAAGLLFHLVLYTFVIVSAFVMSRVFGVSWKILNK